MGRGKGQSTAQDSMDTALLEVKVVKAQLLEGSYLHCRVFFWGRNLKPSANYPIFLKGSVGRNQVSGKFLKYVLYAAHFPFKSQS